MQGHKSTFTSFNDTWNSFIITCYNGKDSIVRSFDMGAQKV